jgi:hypothetical protein
MWDTAAQTKLEDAESKVQMLEELVQRLVLSQVGRCRQFDEHAPFPGRA